MLTVAQIIAQACQDASVPGFTTQAGNKLNVILQKLAQDYNLSSATFWLSGVFDSGIGGDVHSANVVSNSGPYQLPSNFLRFNFHDFFWQNGGINYFPTPLDDDEFDQMVQQPGFSTYPTAYYVDTSTNPYGLYVWPAPSAAYQYFGRYQGTNDDIVNPPQSSTVPWFPSQQYLLDQLTYEMMKTTGDTRLLEFKGIAEGTLNMYLKKEGNRDTRTAKVKLDPRSFGPSWQRLPGTKIVPW